MMDEIERVLDARVRPQLRLHGGDIQPLSYEAGILRFRFLGQCSGCPSAAITTEQLVEEALREAIPELQQAVMVQDVDPSLLEQARAILRHE